MNTKAAFDGIERKLRAGGGTSVLESFYDERVFGNFWITYQDGDQRLSIVNDRGQLILNNGLADGELQKVLVHDLYAADEKTVLDAIG